MNHGAIARRLIHLIFIAALEMEIHIGDLHTDLWSKHPPGLFIPLRFSTNPGFSRKALLLQGYVPGHCERLIMQEPARQSRQIFIDATAIAEVIA